uniref:Uncharacterized protein n=1 Tax=Bionectria ochroleuca TaxID=29856 RepID=A0A8H7K3V6_BIOOC
MHYALYYGVSLDSTLEQVKSAYQGNQLKPIEFREFVGFTLKTDKDACGSIWKEEFEAMDAAKFPRQRASRSLSQRETFSHNIPLPDMSRCDYTMSTIAHLAIATISRHYTSAVDVLYSTTLSGRNATIKGIEAIVRPTITTVPLPARLLP